MKLPNSSLLNSSARVIGSFDSSLIYWSPSATRAWLKIPITTSTY